MRATLSSLAITGLLAIAACTDSFAPSPSSRPLPADAEATVQSITNEYIVVLSPTIADVKTTATQLANGVGGRIRSTWTSALKGFVATLTPEAATKLRQQSGVVLVEQNLPISAEAVQANPPSWGLDRIDQHALPLNQSYVYNSAGVGIHIYIIDTGIRAGHADFAGRVLPGVTFVADGNGTNDCNGHGTHVASTAAGLQYGVAKLAALHAVRVLDCAGLGDVATVINGVNWVMANDVGPAVTNMSIGGAASAALNMAVNNLVGSGNVVTVAAGNQGGNACTRSPASAASAITVAATAGNDTRPAWSNFGGCLDIFAPGAAILGAWNTSNVATQVMSGTSMAAPHVAGAVAKLRMANPLLTPAQIRAQLMLQASAGAVVGAGVGSPNVLLYSR